MVNRSFAKAAIVALALALATLPPISATMAAPLRDGGTILAQQDQGATDDQTAGDPEALDGGPATTNEPTPAAGEAQEQTPSGQPADDVETLDNGPTTTNQPPPPASQTTTAPATLPPSQPPATLPPSQPPPQGGQTSAPGAEAAAPVATEAAGMTAQQFFTMPHSCVVATAGRAYAAVNCDPAAEVQVGFAPPGQAPPISISSGAAGGQQNAAPPPPPPARPAPTAAPESSATGSAQSNSRSTKRGSATTANDNGASTQSSEPVVTFSGPQGTVKRVGNATIVTGASQDSEQRTVRNANGTTETSNQSGENAQKAGNLKAAKHAAKKHGKHGKKHGKKKHGKHGKHKHHDKQNKQTNDKQKNDKHNKGKAKRSGAGDQQANHDASAGNGGVAHAEANGGTVSIGGRDAGGNPGNDGQSKTKRANGG